MSGTVVQVDARVAQLARRRLARLLRQCGREQRERYWWRRVGYGDEPQRAWDKAEDDDPTRE